MLVAGILDLCKSCNIELTAMWIATTENVLADNLSRLLNEYVLRLRPAVYDHMARILNIDALLEVHINEDVE